MQGESVVGCLDAARQDEFYRALIALSIPTQKARQDHLTLPLFIPLLTNAIPEIPDLGADHVYAISMETLLKKSGDLRFKSPEHLRKTIGLPEDARIALIGTVKDEKLERFWTRSTDLDVWRRIAALDFEFVTSCTFSIWYQHPRFDQIYNQQRNLLTHDFLSCLGVPSIPFLMFSGEQRDYEENIMWLKSRPEVRIVAVRGQNRREGSEFIELIDEMRALSNDIPWPLHFLVAGCSEAQRIAEILGEFNATIVSGKPFMTAINWRRATSNLDFFKVPHKEHGFMTLFGEEDQMTKKELVLHNLEQYETFCARIQR